MMARPCVSGYHAILIRLVDSLYDPRPEAEMACRFDEQGREIPTGSPPAIKGLYWRLGAFVLTALIRDPSRDASSEVLEQRKRVGRLGTDERLCPIL